MLVALYLLSRRCALTCFLRKLSYSTKNRLPLYVKQAQKPESVRYGIFIAPENPVLWALIKRRMLPIVKATLSVYMSPWHALLQEGCGRVTDKPASCSGNAAARRDVGISTEFKGSCYEIYNSFCRPFPSLRMHHVQPQAIDNGSDGAPKASRHTNR